jgi:hypothetical protein
MINSKEIRTPKEWTKNCLQMLQKSNPNYRINNNIKGNFIEFLREDDSGMLISTNFYRKRVLGIDTYYLCFALLLTSKNTNRLYHPLIIGSRFDTNRTIWKLFDEDLGLFHTDEKCPKGIWSYGEWRGNTMERLERGLLLPEEYLYPYYRNV